MPVLGVYGRDIIITQPCPTQYNQRSMMPLAEWVCLLMVCEGAYGWAVYHINQACHWIFGHHSPLTSRQPLTPRVTICWWLLLFLLPNKQCHWSSSHSFGNYCLFHEAAQLCFTRILFLLIWLTSGLVWDVLRWYMGILQHTAFTRLRYSAPEKTL